MMNQLANGCAPAGANLQIWSLGNGIVIDGHLVVIDSH